MTCREMSTVWAQKVHITHPTEAKLTMKITTKYLEMICTERKISRHDKLGQPEILQLDHRRENNLKET